jgi:hypothetical protein
MVRDKARAGELGVQTGDGETEEQDGGALWKSLRKTLNRKDKAFHGYPAVIPYLA